MDVKEIWESLKAELLLYVKRKVTDEQTADDIIQEVFEKVIKNIQKLNRVENMREYLYKVTRNTMIDSFRSKKLVFEEFEEHKDLRSTFAEPFLEESLNSIIAKCCITPFINKLPEKYREALIESDIKNVSQKDLAKNLNISYSGVKSRVQRGREKLKNLIQDCCNFEHDSYGNLIHQRSERCKC